MQPFQGHLQGASCPGMGRTHGYVAEANMLRRPEFTAQPGLAILQLLQFIDGLNSTQKQHDLAGWRTFVHTYFTDYAMMRLSLTSQQAQTTHSPRVFELPILLLPIFFWTNYESGVSQIQFVLGTVKEHNSLDAQYVFNEFFLASRLGDLEMIQQLPLSMINMFQQDENGNTALHMASANGNLNVVEFLLSQLSKINHERHYISIQNHRGNTPLHWAAMNGHLEVVCRLVKEGADLHIQNDVQKTPLLEAEFHGKTDVAVWLLKYSDLTEMDEIMTVEP
ncbi:hypothetical protein PCK1_002227 [Pneumocystis canis]|nr:hypothetical protein PCK1_002227 [Pneumocystis canis]